MRFSRWQMADDPHRPGYHFLPPDNWMNDTNGVIRATGQYGLFFNGLHAQLIATEDHSIGGVPSVTIWCAGAMYRL